MQSSIDRLGTIASHGCIRLQVQHAQWLCNNCPTGTKVIIHNGVDDPRITEALGKKAGTDMTPSLPGPVLAKSVTLDREGTVSLNIGETLKLGYSIDPADSTTKQTWSSSAKKYATVDSKGVVTAVNEGTATITLKTSNGKKDTVKIKVVDPCKPTKVVMDQEGTITVNLGEKLRIKAKLSPKTATRQLTWTTTNAKVARVTEYGTILPQKEGTVTIKVRTHNGLTDTVKVKIVDPYKPTGVKLNKSGTLTLNIGETLQLSAALQPSTAKGDIRWVSSKRAYATVDENGVVTPHAEGKVKIAAKTAYGDMDYVYVNIVDASRPTKVKLDQTGTIALKMGEKLKLKASLSPRGATRQLTWTSSDTGVAKVTEYGTILPRGEGTATIKVKTHNGLTASVKVKITDPNQPTGVKLNKSGTITLKEGETLQLKATVEPKGATRSLKWTTSYRKYATVDANGLVTAHVKGEANIAVKTSNGIIDRVKIKVIPD